MSIDWLNHMYCLLQVVMEMLLILCGNAFYFCSFFSWLSICWSSVVFFFSIGNSIYTQKGSLIWTCIWTKLCILRILTKGTKYLTILIIIPVSNQILIIIWTLIQLDLLYLMNLGLVVVATIGILIHLSATVAVSITLLRASVRLALHILTFHHLPTTTVVILHILWCILLIMFLIPILLWSSPGTSMKRIWAEIITVVVVQIINVAVRKEGVVSK